MRVFRELLLPTFLVHLTRALLITTLPLFVLTTLQESKSLAGIAVGAIGLGKVLSDIPAGILLERIGARNLMVVCGLIISASALLMLIASQALSYGMVVVAMVLCGAGESLGVISRLATVADDIPPEERGRVSALLGGSARIAMAVGPLYSGLIVTWTGSSNSVFLSQAVLAFLSVIVVYFTRTDGVGQVRFQTSNIPPTPFRQVVGVLFNVTVFILSLQLIRQCRKLLIPLAAFTAGLSVTEVSIFTSISFIIDACLFPLAGKVMDEYGRVFTGVLSASVMTIALLTVVPAISYHTLLVAAIGTGIGNGFSSGIIVAFGADLAPNDSSKSKFLGYFRLFADLGELIGPLIVGTVSQFASIPTMINTVVAIGVVGSFWLVQFVPDTGWGKFPSSLPVPSSPHNVNERELKPLKSTGEDDDSPFN
jgi:MFS family permease